MNLREVERMLQTAERTVTTIMPSGIIVAPENRKIRVAPYCRVSTDSEEQAHSFAAQLQYYTELVENMPNSELVDIYADEGISGRGTKKREDFNRLISDCKKGKIDRVITKSVSRFARNTVDCLENVRLLSSYGVTVYFEKEDIDTAKMSNEMLLAISGMQAQEESISHGKNMSWYYKKRMLKGEFLGCTATYGYILLDCGRAIINEVEAKVVRLIKDLYLAGLSTKRIAEYLNQNNIPRRNGKKWYPTTIRYILTNERYVGDALLQKTITTHEYPPKRIKNDGSQPQYYVENCLPAIFSREDREAILRIMESRKTKFYNRGGHKLSGLLYCSECGHSFRRIVRKSSIIWGCSYYTAGKGCNYKVTVDENDVIQTLINMLNKLWLNRKELILPIIEKFEIMQSKVNGTELKIKSVDNEIAKLSKQSMVITELIKNGILDTADFYSQQNEISTRLMELRRKRRDYLNEKNNDESLQALYNLYESLEDVEEPLKDYDEEIIRAIVKKVKVISSTEIKIELYCGLILTEYLPLYYSKRGKKI